MLIPGDTEGCDACTLLPDDTAGCNACVLVSCTLFETNDDGPSDEDDSIGIASTVESSTGNSATDCFVADAPSPRQGSDPDAA